MVACVIDQYIYIYRERERESPFRRIAQGIRIDCPRYMSFIKQKRLN